MAHFLFETVPPCPDEPDVGAVAGDGRPLDPDTVHLEVVVGDTVEIEALGYAGTDLRVGWTLDSEPPDFTVSAVEGTGPGAWDTQVPLEPGIYLMHVGFKWPGGDASYVVRINVS